MEIIRTFNELIKCVAALAVFSSVLDVAVGQNTDGFGFRTVCSMSVMLTVVSAIGAFLKV